MPNDTFTARPVRIPSSLTNVEELFRYSNSSGLSWGFFFCNSRNFLGSKFPMNAMRTMRNPSEPILDTLSAMYMSMPWMTDITAMSVVVARMIPKSVRKLRSLLPRKESAATEAASRNDAVWAILS